MLKPIQLDAAQLAHYIETESVLFAKCGATGMEFRITLSGGFVVLKNGQPIGTFSPDERELAIATFNGGGVIEVE